jgi:hypothetical protein
MKKKIAWPRLRDSVALIGALWIVERSMPIIQAQQTFALLRNAPGY